MDSTNEVVMIPLIAKENSDVRHLKIFKWLIIALLISNIAWLGSWVVYWCAPQDSENVTIESGEYAPANYIDGEGDIVNGKDYSK